MKPFLLVLALSWAAAVLASADDQVRRIQEELRKRNLYFGEVDGRKTEETAGAIRRYQQRQGLPPTGELSAPTLGSLGIVRPAAGATEWPEGPVLRSDAARELRESDQRALEELTATPEAPVAEPPPEPPPPPAPPARPIAPPPPLASAEETETPTDFVKRYLAACVANRVAEEMSFYAPQVNYFDHGVVETPFIERDVQRFYKRWPHRHYDLLTCKISPARGGEWEAMFRIAFRYANDKAQVAAGKSVNIFKIRRDPGGMHFTSMKEQVLRD